MKIETAPPKWKTVCVSKTGDTTSAPSDIGRGGQLSVLMLPKWGQVCVMVALCIGVVGAAFEMYAIQAVLPFIVPDLHREDLYLWPVIMFQIGQVFSVIVSGRLIDRFGAFKPLAVGVTLFAIGLTLAGSSTTMYTFLAARAVQGLGAGAMNIAVMVVIAEVYPEQRRSIMMTIFSFCYLGPAFIGPGLAARIAVTLGWRWVFWLIIPFLVIAAIIGTRSVEQLYRHRPHRGSSPGEVPVWAAVAGTVGMAMLLSATQSVEHFNWYTVPLGVVGLVTVGAAMQNMMPRGFWRIKSGMASLMWVRLSLAGAFTASISLLTKLLIDDRGYAAEKAAWALAVGAIGWASGTVLQSRPWLKLRRDQIIIIGSLFESIAIAAMAGFAASKAPQGHFDYLMFVAIAALLLAGFGMGLSSASTSLALMTLSPPEAIGRNTSNLQVADGLGSAFIAGIANVMLNVLINHGVTTAHTFGWIYGVNAVFALASALLALRLGHVRNESSGFG